MKYTAITDGGKYGVDETGNRYLRTQGLELLPDGEEFEAEVQCQWRVRKKSIIGGHHYGWENCDEWHYDAVIDENARRQVLAPLVKDETEYLLSGNNGERLKESIGQLSTPEPVEQEGVDKIHKLYKELPDCPLKEHLAQWFEYRQSLKQSDAVEFAEWLMDSNYSQSAINGKWYDYTVKDKDLVHYTTEELYKLFTLK